MVISILTRKTRIKERAVWEAALGTVLPKITGILQGEPEFVSVQYAWSAENDGEFAQITTWQTLDGCRAYVRGGGAATVATLEDAVVPTASHPDGAWVRKTFEALP